MSNPTESQPRSPRLIRPLSPVLHFLSTRPCLSPVLPAASPSSAASHASAAAAAHAAAAPVSPAAARRVLQREAAVLRRVVLVEVVRVVRGAEALRGRLEQEPEMSNKCLVSHVERITTMILASPREPHNNLTRVAAARKPHFCTIQWPLYPNGLVTQ